MIAYPIADLFCGAGGTSTGAMEAIQACGYRPELTAVNHWPVAVATHQKNHPGSRHLCANIDSINPRDLFGPKTLKLLWGSPECTNHSPAGRNMPVVDQSRATAWCVTRWAEALRPDTVLVENVPEFRGWGPLDTRGRPILSRKGDTFNAWLNALRSLNYQVDYQILTAADYGDPTTRRRLFIQAVQGKRRRIVWPDATHAPEGDIFGRAKWVSALEGVIDWSIPGQNIFTRKRPLAANTLRKINEGLVSGGAPMIIAMEHGGRVISGALPLPTVTTAKGGAFGIAYLLPQHSGGVLRPATKPAPTVAAAGARIQRPDLRVAKGEVRLVWRLLLSYSQEVCRKARQPFWGEKSFGQR